jgi:hypothetical protein
MKRKDVLRLADSQDTIMRVLARSWLDADTGDWPRQNAGQWKSLVEKAISQRIEEGG